MEKWLRVEFTNSNMSAETKKFLGDGVKYILYISIGISGWLIKEDFQDMKEEVHKLNEKIGQVTERLVRIETKIEHEN